MFTFMQTEYKNIKINESYSNLKEPKEIQENRLPDLIFDVVITKGLHILKNKNGQIFHYSHGIIHAKIHGDSTNIAEITEGGHNVPPPQF